MCYTFDNKIVGQWTMDDVVKYMKVVGGGVGQEGLIVGLVNGEVSMVIEVVEYLNNFSVAHDIYFLGTQSIPEQSVSYTIAEIKRCYRVRRPQSIQTKIGYCGREQRVPRI